MAINPGGYFHLEDDNRNARFNDAITKSLAFRAWFVDISNVINTIRKYYETIPKAELTRADDGYKTEICGSYSILSQWSKIKSIKITSGSFQLFGDEYFKGEPLSTLGPGNYTNDVTISSLKAIFEEKEPVYNKEKLKLRQSLFPRVYEFPRVYDPALNGHDPANFPYELVAMWVPLVRYTDDSGSKSDRDIVFARPMKYPGWYFLGQFARDDHQSDLTGYGAILVQPVKGKNSLALPNGFTRRWGVSHGSNSVNFESIDLNQLSMERVLPTLIEEFGTLAEVSLKLIDQSLPNYPEVYNHIQGQMISPIDARGKGLYSPNAPSGFVGISDVWENTDEQTNLQFPDYACVRQDLVKPSPLNWSLWDDHGSGANDDGSVYGFYDTNLVRVPTGKNAFFPFKAFSNYPNSPEEAGNAYTLDWSKVYFIN